MLSLPPLTGLPAPCRLPLAEDAAAVVIEALLASDPVERSTRLSAALSISPSLSLWTVCQAAREEQLPRTASAAAEWLAPRLAHQLQGLAPAAADWPVSYGPQREGELRRTSLTVARIAADLARRHGEEAEAGACWAGLLHRAKDWIAVASPLDEIGDDFAVLPAWLQDLIADLQLTDRDAVRPIDRTAASPEWLAEIVGLARHRAMHDRDAIQDLEGSSASSNIHEILPVLAERIARLEQLESEFGAALHSAKLHAMKEFAYGAGHEINNPLANISARAQTLLKDERDPERRRKLAAINTQAFRAHEMIADMMLFARPPKLARSKIDLNEVIDRVLGDLASDAGQRGTELIRTGTGSIAIDADPSQLKMAIRALCLNALEAVGQGGRVEVAAAMPDAARVVEITICDTGPGIPDAVLPHIFDPFYSGREAGRGLGFGLSKCWQIVTSHGGTIHVESQSGRGSVFRLRLPASA